MLKKIDHFGVAVHGLEKALGVYRDGLGLELGGIEEVPQEGVRVAFLPIGETRLELLEPTNESSPIARFLEKRGEGLHHVCFQVDELERRIPDLQARGLELLPGYPREGAEGERVAFFHPRSTGGVLIELREKGGGGSA